MLEDFTCVEVTGRRLHFFCICDDDKLFEVSTRDQRELCREWVRLEGREFTDNAVDGGDGVK